LITIRSVDLHRAAYKPQDFPRDDRPQYAFVGRSNVGKSSLINALVGKKNLARVSQTPGKTQAIHFYLLNEKIYLVDLPGYGYAKVSKSMIQEWGDLIRGYLDGSQTLELLFLLLDARRVPSGQDVQMVEWLEAAGVAWVPVLTKTDKLSKNELAKQKSVIARELGVEPERLIGFSKMTKDGVERIWREIAV
jgi:GTP-binding protein